jgi:3-oxoacyl-[acyl-carrier-protein] synthase-3
MSPYAHITGWGKALPARVLSNEELGRMVDTNDEWIVTHTGIHERRIASPTETTASLGAEAALKALAKANVRPDEVDLIIVATSSPEHVFPATACTIQDQIGATKAGAFDLSAACSGFIFALNMATQSIRSGAMKCILVIGAETLSRLTNWEDRNTCILFGDGAGAFVLQAGEAQGGVLSGVMHADGSGGKLLSVPAGGSRQPTTLETVQNKGHYIQMNGREVFRFASRVMVQATHEALAAAKLTIEDVQLIIPHQANGRIIEAAVRGLEIPPERCMINIDHYGNTSTASIPMAACEAVEAGRLKDGDKVVFVGFGAGLTWGAVALQWTGPFPATRKLHPASYRLWARLRSWMNRTVRRVEGVLWSDIVR